MDRERFSFIAHASHVFCNPVSPEKFERALGALALPAGARTLDIGAGTCEMLLRVVEHVEGSGVGIEPGKLFAAEARRRVVARGLADLVRVVEDKAEPALASAGLARERFDLVMCVGALNALGGLVPTLERAKALLRPRGRVLVGEGYWKRPPAKEHLEALGGTEDECATLAETVARVERTGFTPVSVVVACDDDWDEYEWRYARSVERFVRDHPADPDRGAMLERSRRWRSTVMQWGRDTLGFALIGAELPG